MEIHPADWFPVKGIPYGSYACDRDDVLYSNACDCDDCVRLKKAADQIDDMNWYDNDQAAKVVAEAQKALWQARKKLHQLHAADRYSVRKYGRHLKDTPREELYFRSELEWDGGFDGGEGGSSYVEGINVYELREIATGPVDEVSYQNASDAGIQC